MMREVKRRAAACRRRRSVVVHTGGVEHFRADSRRICAGRARRQRALAVHDVEFALTGTSLGIDLAAGAPVEQGHRNPWRRQHHQPCRRNPRCRESGVLKSGVMRVRHARRRYVLAGSIRDDDAPGHGDGSIAAQNAMPSAVKQCAARADAVVDAHSIGVGNMLPSWCESSASTSIPRS